MTIQYEPSALTTIPKGSKNTFFVKAFCTHFPVPLPNENFTEFLIHQRTQEVQPSPSLWSSCNTAGSSATEWQQYLGTYRSSTSHATPQIKHSLLNQPWIYLFRLHKFMTICTPVVFPPSPSSVTSFLNAVLLSYCTTVLLYYTAIQYSTTVQYSTVQ